MAEIQQQRLYHMDVGGGVKGGYSYGATDEHGYEAGEQGYIHMARNHPASNGIDYN